MLCDVCGLIKEGLVLLHDENGRLAVCQECIVLEPPYLRRDKAQEKSEETKTK